MAVFLYWVLVLVCNLVTSEGFVDQGQSCISLQGKIRDFEKDKIPLTELLGESKKYVDRYRSDDQSEQNPACRVSDGLWETPLNWGVVKDVWLLRDLDFNEKSVKIPMPGRDAFYKLSLKLHKSKFPPKPADVYKLCSHFRTVAGKAKYQKELIMVSPFKDMTERKRLSSLREENECPGLEVGVFEEPKCYKPPPRVKNGTDRSGALKKALRKMNSLRKLVRGGRVMDTATANLPHEIVKMLTNYVLIYSRMADSLSKKDGLNEAMHKKFEQKRCFIYEDGSFLLKGKGGIAWFRDHAHFYEVQLFEPMETSV